MDNKKDVVRVGIYLRLSDEDRDKTSKFEVSESIKNQRYLLMSELEKRPEFVLVDEYCDEDLSGAGTYRPQFERLIKDCEGGKLDVVLCKSQSRFSRDMEIVERYIHNKFSEWKVRFIGVADNADTENSGNKKSRQINGLVNEWYLEDVSNNIRSAFRAKMKQGEFISPFAPFGYDISVEDNNKLVVDPIASLVVKKIFDLYVWGLGFGGIAKYLNERRVPSPSLYKYQRGIKLNVISKRPRETIGWSSNAIKTILTNEVYLGHLIQGKRTTISYKNHKIKKKDREEWVRRENTHDAIVSCELFDKVRIIMKERRRVLKQSARVHNFSGKVFCLECGSYMRKKNSGKYDYLVCSSSSNSYSDCVNRCAIRYDILEEIVLEMIKGKLEEFYDEDILQKEVMIVGENSFFDKVKVLEKERIEVKKRKEKIDGYLKSLYEDKVNGIITVNQFSSLVEEYNREEDICNRRLKVIGSEIDFWKLKESELREKGKVFIKYRTWKSLNRVIVEEFISKIYVGKVEKEMNNRVVRVEWDFD